MYPLVKRLLRNRTAFYRELFQRLDWDEVRLSFQSAVGDLPESGQFTEETDSEQIETSLLSALKLGKWLKKDGIGLGNARRIISVENALDEALALEQTGILLCVALVGAHPESVSELESVRNAHERAFIALSQLRDALEYHRMTVSKPDSSSQDSGLAQTDE